MNQPTKETPEEQPPSLGNTLLMLGICVVLGIVIILAGFGIIPSKDPNPSVAARVMATGAGLIFILAGLAFTMRDLAGARNNEDIPQNAPLLLRLGDHVFPILIVAAFAVVASAIAFGPFFAAGALPDLTRQMGSIGAAIFRTVMGGLALVFWYIVVYLAYDKIRKARGKAP